MRLYIDLTPQEESDIHGWVNKGLAEPEFANYPWRIVLAERSRARFDQIAAQFGAIGPTPPPPPPGDVTFIPYGDFNRYVFSANTTDIVSFAFRVPTMPPGGWPGPNGSQLRLSIATFGGTDMLRRTCVSLDKGKLDGDYVAVGKETAFAFNCGVEFAQGALVYINTIALEEVATIGAQKSSVSIIWPPLVYP